MKSRWAFNALLICFFLPLSALPVGNPWEPYLLDENLFCFDHLGAVRTGFWGDYVFNQKLELDSKNATIDRTRVYTNAAYFSWGLCQRVDFFAALGATNISIQTPASAFHYRHTGTLALASDTPLNPNNFPNIDPNGLLSLYTDTDFSYTFGVRGILWKCRNFVIGGSGQYFYTNPHVRRLMLPEMGQFTGGDVGGNPLQVFLEAPSNIYPKSAIHFKYQHWQIALSGGFQFCIAPSLVIAPYGGIKWDQCRVNLGQAILSTTATIPSSLSGVTFDADIPLAPFQVELLDLRVQQQFGYVIGVNLLGCGEFSLGIEGRFANERALYLNMQLQL